MSDTVSGTRSQEGTEQSVEPAVSSTPPPTPSTSTTSTGQHRAVIINDTNQAVRVVRASVPKLRAWSVLVLLVAALVSFLAVSQLRGDDPFRQQLETENEG